MGSSESRVGIDQIDQIHRVLFRHYGMNREIGASGVIRDQVETVRQKKKGRRSWSLKPRSSEIVRPAEVVTLRMVNPILSELPSPYRRSKGQAGQDS